MTNGTPEEMQQLREEITRLLANALQVVEDLGSESERMQHAHEDEVANLEAASEMRVAHLEAALASRDVIGQAKGIIMVTMHCGPDKAFGLLSAQSQAENRKLVD